MIKHSFALSLALLAVLAWPAVSRGQAGGDVKRRTIAITYFKDPVKVELRGTTLRPTAHGEATVERWRKRNESEIDIKVEGLVPAYNYGGDYTTYVLWAITPEGQVSNLGEFRLSGSSGHLHAATPFQTFAMLVTAEPHFMVHLPSTKLVLENLAPDSKNVQVQVSEIYFNGDSGKYYTDTDIPATAERDFARTPMELLQARCAVQIAKLAEGERYDTADMTAASNALQQAEDAFRRGENVHEIGRIARDSISYAVRTRDISEERAEAALRRSEIERRDEEVREATANASDLQEKLADTTARFRASEIARQNAEDQLNRALRDAADARSENASLRSQIQDLRADNDRMSRDLSDARAKLADLQNQVSAASSKVVEESSRAQAAEQLERQMREAAAKQRDAETLKSTLAGIISVKSTDTGFVAVLPDTFFLTNKTELALKAKSKMDALAHTLAGHPDATFTIEGYSDPRPTADSFAMGRAQAVADYIVALGVSRDNFKVESGGDSNLLSRGRTPRSRSLNRRVELQFSVTRSIAQ